MKFVKEKDYINTVCSYSSISNYMRREDLTPILNHLIGLASQPLTTIEDKFAIDSSGFRTTKFNDYMRKRYEEEREHEWIKLHICCGVKSHIITAVEINMHADTTQFIPLTMQTKENGFVIKEMTADKAYCAGSNYEYISSIGGLPFIPFKSNVTGRSHGRGIIWRKMFRYFQLNRDEFMEHYHARSNVESTFNMIKSKFGDLVRSKDDIAQANELLLKVLCHNIVVLIHESLELGIEPDFIYRR
ncbi:MAG: transposase, partial [Candidatus Micrarchaeota archaeon]|nr:transposase [Candidatus Micrarchaeota archaeon]